MNTTCCLCERHGPPCYKYEWTCRYCVKAAEQLAASLNMSFAEAHTAATWGAYRLRSAIRQRAKKAK